MSMAEAKNIIHAKNVFCVMIRTYKTYGVVHKILALFHSLRKKPLCTTRYTQMCTVVEYPKEKRTFPNNDLYKASREGI